MTENTQQVSVVKQTKKPVAVKEEKKTDLSIDTFIMKAIESNLSVEALERLFNLREKAKAEYAKEQFDLAMSNFQKSCSVIEKTKSVFGKDGTLRYKYAPLDSIVEQVKKPLGENNLSYKFDTVGITKDNQQYIKAVCIVSHVAGHSLSSEFEIPVGTESFMTDPQKYGSRQTFAKRYSFCNALGILTGDEDTDAKDDKKDVENPKNVKAHIMIQLRNLGVDIKDKNKIISETKRLTGIDPKTDAEFNEVASRLQVLINERNENPTIQ